MICVVILPPAKITDVVLAADIGRPGMIRSHHRFVQANGKQNGSVLALLSFKGRFHLGLHPTALDGISGERQQQLIVDVNGFLDFVPETTPDL